MLLHAVFAPAPSMLLRGMTAKDIPGGVRLNTLAGWNQTESDWNRFLRISPDGCFVMEDEETVVGTAATISYENRFAWIGMVLVDPEYRNRGIGTKLLERTVRYLDDAGVATLKLDATPLGKPIYEKMGFVIEYEIERWILRRTAEGERSVGAASVTAPQLSAILAYDQEVFGADRSALLRSLNEQGSDLTVVAGNGGQLQGYAFGRHGLFADHLGPWMARDSGAAEKLLAGFLKRSPRATVIVDALKSNSMSGEILHNRGFSVARPLSRMYRGPNTFPGKPSLLCAIVGPEFG